MANALIVYGCSGSGKTTYAKTKFDEMDGWVKRIERDQIRTERGLLRNGWQGYKFRGEDEYAVTAEWWRDLWYSVESDEDIIVSDTLCKIQDRRNLYHFLVAQGYFVRFVRMNTSLEECVERDSKRGIMSVGEKVISRQWENLNKHEEHI